MAIDWNGYEKQFWRVRECRSGQGHFEVFYEENGREIATGRMSYQDAFNIASKANSEILLRLRPEFRVGNAEIENTEPKGGENA